ncbi:MAG TPA: prepilin peptidase [Clostridia bacterium]|nr:prepilin peptidase [Clostridia bacterium]
MSIDAIIVYSYIFFVGCCAGSFYNVCIYRLPRGESLVRPRSHCTSCGHALGFLDLIPVLSYLTLKGRCRYCKSVVSPRYMLVEIICGIMFVGVFHFYFISLKSLLLVTILSIGLIAGFIAFDMQGRSGRRNNNV